MYRVNTKMALNLYKCSCGNTFTISKYAIKFGHTKSCGCLQKREL